MKREDVTWPCALVSDGLVDLQVNGFAGVDFNDATLEADAFDVACEGLLSTGVCAFLPTLITAPLDVMASRLAALDRAIANSKLGARMVLGYHLEGPFLNPSPGTAGCHPPEAMLLPDFAKLSPLLSMTQKPVLMVTLAPELEGALALIAALHARTIIVALGHSAANADGVAKAARAGAKLATHLGNATPHLGHKFNNPIFASLAEPALMASFIADGLHVPLFALGVMMRARGFDNCILISDAVSAACAPPGACAFAGMKLHKDGDGSVCRADLPGTLAGSSLTLPRAITNLYAFGIASLPQALAMATRNPMALLAPCLNAHGLKPPSGKIAWTQKGRVQRLALDGDVLISS